MEPLRTLDPPRALDPHRIDQPAFTPAAIARYLRLPLRTLRWWALGTTVHEPPLRIADSQEHLMSFRNVVEIHVLKAVVGDERGHVPLAVVRGILSGLGEQLGSEHPLSDARMDTYGKEFLAASLGALAHGTREGYRALSATLALHLGRIVRDGSGEPTRLLLFTRPGPSGPGHVMMDPEVRGGQPCLTDTDVTTSALAARFKAGEPVLGLARDCGRSHEEIEEAIRYEMYPG